MQQIGPYQVLEELARGGMGVVYRARDPRVGRDLALKVLLEFAAQPEELVRFQIEAEALGRLRHPSVVPVHDLGWHGGKPYLAMDLVAGESLHARLKRTGPLDAAAARRLALELAGALEAAHAQGILHRDLKPQNVLVTPEGRAVLIDFGLAKIGGEGRQSLTQSGEVMGTPAYMAPEQARGERAEFGPHTDVYGLGAILYTALTGAPPFTGTSLLAVLARVANEPVTPPSQVCSVDADLEAIVLRCLEKDPAARYPNAAALAQALGAVGTAASAPRVPLGAVLGVGGLTVGALVLLAIVGPASSPEQSKTPPVASPAPVPSVARLDAPPEQVPRESLEALVEHGEERLRRGDLTSAREAFEKALVLAPASPGALRGLATVLFEWQNPGGALELLERIPGSPSAELEGQRALYLAARGDEPEAIELAEQLVAREPRSGQAHLALARVCERLGKTQRSLEAIEQALQFEPKSVEALVVRSTIRGGTTRRGRGLASAQRALGLDPDSAEVLLAIAVAEFKRGEPDAAVAAMREILERSPRHVRAQFGLGMGYLALKEYGRAVPEFDRTLELAPGYPRAVQARAVTVFELNRKGKGAEAQQAVEGALASLKALNEANPWRVEGHRALGKMLLKLQSYEQAAVAMGQAIEAAGGKGSENYLLRGQALHGLGRLEEAARDWVRAADLAPANKSAQHRAGVILFQLKNFKEAKKYLRRRVELPEPLYRDLFRLGVALHWERELGEAVKVWTLALQRAKERWERRDAFLWRGRAFDALERHELALADFRKGEALDPTLAGDEVLKERMLELEAELGSD